MWNESWFDTARMAHLATVLMIHRKLEEVSE